MTGAPAGSDMIRLARLDELSRLTEIELDAFATLADARGGDLEAHALLHDALRQSLQAGLLFVAVDGQNRPVAFLAAIQHDETLHICEIDVARDWQRQGIGRQLMAKAVDAARAGRLRGVTLTTDRFVPFNAPFYARLGFCEIADDDALPELRKTLAAEVADAAGARRVAMISRFR
jgi:predicted N-acetyltransferase YhbS